MLIAGIGSPHGDDAIAWRVIDEFGGEAHPGLRLLCIAEPVDLLMHLPSEGGLIVVDACQEVAPGDVAWLTWPDDRIASVRTRSTHALGIAATLRLAERLTLLPDAATLMLLGAATHTADAAGRLRQQLKAGAGGADPTPESSPSQVEVR